MVTAIEVNKRGDQIVNAKGGNEADRQYALQCKSYDKVLAFLKLPREYELIVVHPYDRYCPQSHSGERTHEESCTKFVSFVELRMDQEKTAHRLFNWIGHKLGPFYEKIAKAAYSYPLIGILPALFVSLMGAIQMILASIFSIIGILFLWSANGRIFEERMVRHIGHGFCNIICGVFLAIPFLGKRIYLAAHPS